MNKTTAFILSTGLAAALPVHAQLYSADSYLTGADPAAGEYAEGQAKDQSPTVLGYAGSYAGDGNVNVTASGLAYTGLETEGGALTADAYGRAGRTLSASYGDLTTGTVYLAFLLQLGDTSNGQLPSYAALELYSGTQRTLQLGSSPGDFGTSTNFGLRLFDSGSLTLELGAFDTDVNLFVLKIEFSDLAGGDTLTVYQNPSNLSVEGANAAIGVLTGFDFDFDRISLANYSGNAAGIALDEMRIAGSFKDVLNVTPVPEPVHAGMVVAGGLLLTALRRQRMRKA